ncbi:exonuclease subunit SbcD [Thermosulfuriphilus ammonigenes]|uniref:Nuclease SbcCD subunit D n=1 Tax=Thermosulfuriphilus ammonigenes TaxID=1936021 RepID=A0A6G7PXA9_9BACT|nr:exonuclease subunit SbcD [Thermosulfuriphilus ammonigenes]MBA2849570.1 exonuclease SbcD [Thermosulfuriphilus ammonigenes]QIJ72324.1 exonuclease subunit SbcD [Thermosulfuriphilus ammonigenes]
MIRVLHTSDWHLGKTFEGTDFSLLEEQEAALQELVELVQAEDFHLVVVAGDIFDHYLPPATAQRLFYDTLAELSEGGKRPVVVIAGNHDSPDLLTSARGFTLNQGVVMAGRPGELEAWEHQTRNFRLVVRGPQLKIDFPQGALTLFLLPYPSEVRLSGEGSLTNRLRSLAAYLPLGEVDVLLGHIFLERGELAGSERQILGDLAVLPRELLPPARIMALGHLHGYQRFRDACYSGSIFPFSRQEARRRSKKFFSLIELPDEGEPRLEAIPITRPKSVAVVTAETPDEALLLAEDRPKELVFLEISRPPSGPETIERLKKAFSGRLLGLRFAPPQPSEAQLGPSDTRGLTDRDLFVEFYRRLYQKDPPEPLLSLFLRLMSQVGEIA